MFAIYSLTPLSQGIDEHRLVEIFETKQDAEKVLSALEQVNISFNYYKIIECNYSPDK